MVFLLRKQEKAMQRHLQGYLYLTLAMITVGSTVIASRVIASGMPPFTATALRFAAAFPFFLLLMGMTGTRLPSSETTAVTHRSGSSVRSSRARQKCAEATAPARM